MKEERPLCGFEGALVSETAPSLGVLTGFLLLLLVLPSLAKPPSLLNRFSAQICLLPSLDQGSVAALPPSKP